MINKNKYYKRNSFKIKNLTIISLMYSNFFPSKLPPAFVLKN